MTLFNESPLTSGMTALPTPGNTRLGKPLKKNKRKTALSSKNVGVISSRLPKSSKYKLSDFIDSTTSKVGALSIKITSLYKDSQITTQSHIDSIKAQLSMLKQKVDQKNMSQVSTDQLKKLDQLSSLITQSIDKAVTNIIKNTSNISTQKNSIDNLKNTDIQKSVNHVIDNTKKTTDTATRALKAENSYNQVNQIIKQMQALEKQREKHIQELKNKTAKRTQNLEIQVVKRAQAIRNQVAKQIQNQPANKVQALKNKAVKHIKELKSQAKKHVHELKHQAAQRIHDHNSQAVVKMQRLDTQVMQQIQKTRNHVPRQVKGVNNGKAKQIQQAKNSIDVAKVNIQQTLETTSSKIKHMTSDALAILDTLPSNSTSGKSLSSRADSSAAAPFTNKGTPPSANQPTSKNASSTNGSTSSPATNATSGNSATNSAIGPSFSASQAQLDRQVIGIDLDDQTLGNTTFLQTKTAQVKNRLALIELAEQMDNRKANNAGAIA